MLDGIEYRIGKLPSGRFAILYETSLGIKYLPVAFESEEDARKELQRQVDLENAKMENLLHGNGVGPPIGVLAKEADA